MKFPAKFSRLVHLMALTVLVVLVTDAHSQNAGEPHAAPGQISGHIYRADSGAPMANAVVEVGAMSQRTATDGSYAVDVPAGHYWVVSYKTGFVPKLYGDNTPPACPTCFSATDISIGPGQRIEGINLRLTADPPIETLLDGPITATYPDHKYWVLKVRFAPDGSTLALVTTSFQTAPNGPDEVWLYEMRSRRSVPAVLPASVGVSLVSDQRAAYVATRYGPEDTDIAWDTDNTLYVNGGNEVLGTPPLRVAATMTGAKEIRQFPSDIQAAFAQRPEIGRPSGPEKCSPLISRNGQFVVTLQPTGRGCNGTKYLAMRKSDGSGAHQIGSISGDGPDFYFLFDKRRSLVIYAKDLGTYRAAQLVTFDMKTLQSRATAMPVQGQFLDETPATAGTLVAYYVKGLCEPDDSMMKEAFNAPGLWQLCIARTP
jgi:hypothetical protein